MNYLTLINNIYCSFFIILLSCSSQKNYPEENLLIETYETDTVQNVDTSSVFKCDINKVAHLKRSMENLNSNDILSFLLTISEECKNNIEYSQLSNEVLFEIFNEKPELILQLIESNKEIDTSQIFFMLRNPINDQINLLNIILKLQKIENREMKSHIINQLEISYKKNHTSSK